MSRYLDKAHGKCGHLGNVSKEANYFRHVRLSGRMKRTVSFRQFCSWYRLNLANAVKREIPSRRFAWGLTLQKSNKA